MVPSATDARWATSETRAEWNPFSAKTEDGGVENPLIFVTQYTRFGRDVARRMFAVGSSHENVTPSAEEELKQNRRDV